MSRRSHVTAASETAAPSGNTLSSPADTALSPASPSPLPALPLALPGATHALPTQLAPAPQRDGPVPRGQQLPNTGRERTDPPAPMHTAAHATQTAAGAGGPLPYWAPPSHPAVPPGPARHGAPQMPPTESWTHAGQRDWTRYHDAPAMVPPPYAVPRQTDPPAPADPATLATVTPATGDTAADTRRPRSRRRERSRTHSAVSSGRYNPPRSRRRRHRSGSAGDSPDAPPASRARVSNDHPVPVQHRARHVRGRSSSSSSSSTPLL